MSDFYPLTPRKVKPLAGHKCEILKICFRTYCECGWSSCPHWERAEAYSEWREHVLSHGGEKETAAEHIARDAREKARLNKKFAALSASPAPKEKGAESPYASQADAWNEALEKAAEIVERYNAGFNDPECGCAPDDIRVLKRLGAPISPNDMVNHSPAPKSVEE